MYWNIIVCLSAFLIPLQGLSSTVSNEGNSNPWEFAKEDAGIKVYLRDKPGSGFKEYRGEGVINAELNTLMALMDDTNACVDWMLNCKDPQLISKVSMVERYIYQVNNLPWPVTDRDMIIRTLISQDESTRAVTVGLQAVQLDDLPVHLRNRVPAGPDYIRVESLNGYWKFIPIDGQSTKAIYQNHVELGGNLTPAIVNIAIVNSPIKTIKRMREVAMKDKYRCFKPF